MKYLIFLLFLSCIAFPSSNYKEELIIKARKKKIWNKNYWHLLLHYKKKFLWGYKSEVDDPSFFISKKGKTNPEDELYETIKSFFNPVESYSDKNFHPQCTFIARLMWLKNELSLNEAKLPHVDCIKYKKWKKKLSVESVTLVFASYYLSNPASAFGHTLLRLNTEGWRKEVKLINYGVNYGVDFEKTPGPITYVLGGLLGWFPGSFSIFPYYMKVQEYNNLEWRDMWEYDIDLKKAEINRFMAHLWELGGIYFDYFFLKENCSYHVLSLFEIAKPELKLQNKFKFVTVPAQTIKLFKKYDLIKKKTYRPSIVSKFKQRYALLNRKEEEVFKKINKDFNNVNNKEFKKLPDKSKARVLDAFLDYDHYLKTIAKTKLINENKINLYLERSKIKYTEPEENLKPVSTSPENGHDIHKISLGAGFSNSRFFQEISARFSYHELLDPPIGYDQGSEVLFLNTFLRYYKDENKVYLHGIDFLKGKSLTPVDAVSKKSSWKFNLSLKEFSGQNKNSFHYFDFNYGFGFTFKPRDINLYAFTFIDTNIKINSSFNENLNFGFGNTSGFLLTIYQDLAFLGEGKYSYFLSGNTGALYSLKAYLRFVLYRNSDIRLSAQRIKNINEYKITLSFFY